MPELKKYPIITDDIVKEHGLSLEEYDNIKDILNRIFMDF